MFILILINNIFLIITEGSDITFEKIKKINMENYSVNVYLTNEGATSDFGIVIRQEKELILGILLVKNIYKKYHQKYIECKKINDNSLKIEGNIIKLNKYLYF